MHCIWNESNSTGKGHLRVVSRPSVREVYEVCISTKQVGERFGKADVYAKMQGVSRWEKVGEGATKETSGKPGE